MPRRIPLRPSLSAAALLGCLKAHAKPASGGMFQQARHRSVIPHMVNDRPGSAPFGLCLISEYHWQ